MNWQRILYGLLLIFVGACVSTKPAHRAPRKPLFPKRRHEVKVEPPGEAKPAKAPDCTCEKCKCDPCVCKAEAPKPASTGKWVLVNRPVYGGFRGRQFQGYQKVWQWQSFQTQQASSCATGQCR